MGWLKRVIDHDIFYSFTRSWVIMLAAFVTLFIIITSVFAPWLTIHDPFNPSSLNLMDAFTPPIWVEGGKWVHPLGTDDQGRDILSTIMFGNRISLLVGFLSVLLAMLIGVTLGTVSGYIGSDDRLFTEKACQDQFVEVWKKIKKSFDPNGILNPGKFV